MQDAHIRTATHAVLQWLESCFGVFFAVRNVNKATSKCKQLLMNCKQTENVTKKITKPKQTIQKVFWVKRSREQMTAKEQEKSTVFNKL